MMNPIFKILTVCVAIIIKAKQKCKISETKTIMSHILRLLESLRNKHRSNYNESYIFKEYFAPTLSYCFSTGFSQSFGVIIEFLILSKYSMYRFSIFDLKNFKSICFSKAENYAQIIRL